MCFQEFVRSFWNFFLLKNHIGQITTQNRVLFCLKSVNPYPISDLMS